MLGSRFLGDPLAGGMPRWKYVSNRFLTGVENLAFGLHLSEYHTGLRAYSRHLLETVPYELNSDDFVFDQELIAQVVAAGMAPRIGEIAVPDPLLRGGLLGRLPAERRLRPVDAAGRGALPAPSTARSALAEALRVAARTDRPMSISRNALLRGHGRHRDQRRRDLDPDPVGRHRGGVRVLRTASPAWIAVMLVTTTIDIGARGARWRALLAPIAPLPYRRVLGYTYIGYLANNVLPARLGELYRSHALGEGEGVSRTTVLGTVVVERVVDTVMVVAIAALAVVVLSVRGVMSSAVLLGTRLRVAAGHRARAGDGRPPAAGCRAGRPRSSRAGRASSSWRAGCARASPSPAGRERSSAALAFSALAWAASTGTFLAAGQAVGVELSLAQAALLTSGVALVTIVPSGPGYVGTFELTVVGIAEGFGISRDDAFALGLAGPPDDPGHDLDRWRDRDAARCGGAGTEAAAASRGRRGRRPRATGPRPSRPSPPRTPDRGGRLPARLRAAPPSPQDAHEQDHLRGAHRQHGRGRPAR